jgi:hypothetical protein
MASRYQRFAKPRMASFGRHDVELRAVEGGPAVRRIRGRERLREALRLKCAPDFAIFEQSTHLDDDIDVGALRAPPDR